jgi:hypothetical protein
MVKRPQRGETKLDIITVAKSPTKIKKSVSMLQSVASHFANNVNMATIRETMPINSRT